MGMKNLSYGLSLFFIAVQLVVTSAAFADRMIIDELRKLKATLPVNDPARTELSLRIADRLVDESFSETLTQPKKAQADRTEALTLFQEVLPKQQQSAMKTKIRFQMARLYLEQGQNGEAKPLLLQTSQQGELIEVKRESILRLAELAEAGSSAADSKQADKYYQEVLTICNGGDSCSYAHYRMAWIRRNSNDLSGAITEMKAALWDSKGQLREESLRDLIVFTGLQSVNDDQNIAFIDELSVKLNRTSVLDDLGYAYLTSGNKPQGVKVMELVNSRRPTLSLQVRLMEETYGQRNWDKFHFILSQWQASVANPAQVSGMKDAVEVEKICRRLATQLDGERTSDPRRLEDFKAFTLSYLDLFPNNADKAKVMEGYVAAETSYEGKVDQIKKWLNDPKFKFTAIEKIQLRELRAAIAQKEKHQDVVIEEMTALLAMSAESPKINEKSREYRYTQAHAYYTSKDYEHALPLFKDLASQGATGKPDQWAIQSQNLAMDIYNQNKDFANLSAQASLWTNSEALKKNSSVAAEVKEMQGVAEQAAFQSATAAGETQDSLKTFMNYCIAGKFLPKSCDNAKVLAIKLSQHPTLIEILKKTNSQDELVNEYEMGAYFVEAARMLERRAAVKIDFKETLKVALMYELGRDFASRDRILKKATDAIATQKLKLSDLEEKAYYVTLSDASLLNDRLLKMPFSASFKMSLAEMLEETNRGTKETRALLLTSNSYQGSAWSKIILEESQKLSDKEATVKFYGKNGQTLFKNRVNKIKDLNQFAEKILSSGADLYTRVKLLNLLKFSYSRLTDEIKNSPMPAGLNEEQVAQIKVGVEELAKPFAEKAQALQALVETEMNKANPEEKARLSAAAPAAGEATGDSVKMTYSSAKPEFNVAQYQQAILSMHQNPKNVASLTQLKTVYEQAGMKRLAKYFEGRISNESNEKKPEGMAKNESN